MPSARNENRRRFYRTYEGLKLVGMKNVMPTVKGFYRTYEGLKQRMTSFLLFRLRHCFYRTYEGLKLPYGNHAQFQLGYVFIVPMRD